ncbi:MAG: peptide ABC transporter substrate-binding protein [Maricaulaceae bacterium]|nr:peptide ABC transporter substrate-binding protein [Maricaulaceae bacterium]
MTLHRNRLSLLLLGAAALALTACGDRAAQDQDTLVLHRGNNAEPLSLDPHKASGTWENHIIGDMFIGLFTENSEGAPIPGMAESWTVAEDGLSWTFTLREAVWSDGEPVTAHDFEFAFRRILDPMTIAQYASLLYPIRNAQPVNVGELPPEEVGVRALDARTLLIELENPAPFLPGLLTHYTTFPIPRHVVERHGDAWVQPRNIEVNGPYKLAEWRSNDFIRVVRNERFFDNANVCLDEIYYYPTVDVNAAERRVRNGELDLNMEFPGQNINFLMERIPDYVRVAPYMGTVYFSLNTELPQFQDARVRNALGMAIDREFITREIYRVGFTPAYAMVPPGVSGYPGGTGVNWAEEPIEQRRARARELLEEAGYGPANPLRFEYYYRATADNPRIAPVVQNDWQSIAPWVRVDIFQNETQIHYANLRAGDFQAADGGWIADYNDAYNFLFLMEERSIPMNYSRYRNPEYDALVAQANMELDAVRRGDMLTRAEQMMLDDMPIIPIAFYVSKSLVNPRVTGWIDNVVDIHRSRYLCFAGVERSSEVAAAD